MSFVASNIHVKLFGLKNLDERAFSFLQSNFRYSLCKTQLLGQSEDLLKRKYALADILVKKDMILFEPKWYHFSAVKWAIGIANRFIDVSLKNILLYKNMATISDDFSVETSAQKIAITKLMLINTRMIRTKGIYLTIKSFQSKILIIIRHVHTFVLAICTKFKKAFIFILKLSKQLRFVFGHFGKYFMKILQRLSVKATKGNKGTKYES